MMNKLKLKAVLAPFLLVIFPGLLKAQDSSRTLTLNEAIDLSIKNSKQLRAGKARIDQATAAYTQARQNQLPDFQISGSYLRLTQPNIDLHLKTNNSGGAPNNINVNQAAYGIANLSVPLYQGMRIQYGIRSADLLEKASRLDVDNDKEGVILNTINAFTNLYKAYANVRLIRENLAQSRSRDSDFNNLEKNGLLARNDMLKAALQTSNIELNLVDVESNLKLAIVNMDIMVGLPEHTVLVPDSTSLLQPAGLKSIDDYEQLSLQNRKDVQALQYRRQASLIGVKSAKSDLYPSVNLTSGYIAADVPNVITITNAVTFGVGVSYNASSLWKSKAKIDGAKARVAELEADESQLDDDVKLQINQAYLDYVSAEKKIEVSNKAILQGNENYKITKNKYDNSLVTVTDLLDANVALLQAQISFEIARADAIVAYNMLLQKAGVLADSVQKK
jgi:outer membrane protein